MNRESGIQGQNGNLRQSDDVMRAKQEVHSLKLQLQMKRKKTSESIKELVAFIDKGYQQDKLVFPDNDNPFKPKACCSIS